MEDKKKEYSVFGGPEYSNFTYEGVKLSYGYDNSTRNQRTSIYQASGYGEVVR